MWYYFEFDEKIIRSLNNLSRNFEFHQPECLKCVFWCGALFCGGILRFWAKYKNLVDPSRQLHEKFGRNLPKNLTLELEIISIYKVLTSKHFKRLFFLLNLVKYLNFQSNKSLFFVKLSPTSPHVWYFTFVYVFCVIVTRYLKKNAKSSQKTPVFGDI